MKTSAIAAVSVPGGLLRGVYASRARLVNAKRVSLPPSRRFDSLAPLGAVRIVGSATPLQAGLPSPLVLLLLLLLLPLPLLHRLLLRPDLLLASHLLGLLLLAASRHLRLLHLATLLLALLRLAVGRLLLLPRLHLLADVIPVLSLLARRLFLPLPSPARVRRRGPLVRIRPRCRRRLAAGGSRLRESRDVLPRWSRRHRHVGRGTTAAGEPWWWRRMHPRLVGGTVCRARMRRRPADGPVRATSSDDRTARCRDDPHPG